MIINAVFIKVCKNKFVWGKIKGTTENKTIYLPDTEIIKDISNRLLIAITVCGNKASPTIVTIANSHASRIRDPRSFINPDS